MSWLFLSAICLVLATIALATWRKWIAPWRSIEQLVREVAGGQRPRTFLVDGGTQAQRVGLALESIFRRQQQLDLPTGAVVVFHDITQSKRLDQVRSDFVANVSHELRTPLSILRGYIETLVDNPETSREELARILQVMERHSKRLGLLVDDLLSLAQLESSTTTLEIDQVRLPELFDHILRDWKEKLGEKNLKVIVYLSQDASPIRADETRLQEVLYNLLENAVKYSRENGEIRVQAARRGSEIVLSVSDDGIGISKDDLPRIFERFYRADKARTREVGGTGLGLAIVKHIAQLHGGRVEAESELGRGTTIRVVLPGGTGSG